MSYHADIDKDLFVSLIHKINKKHYDINIVKDIGFQVKDQTGLGSLAVRLKDGEDYPYCCAFDFPRNFLDTENCLCRQDSNGSFIKDSDGQPVLECMCGNVIRGRFDPRQPFFTENGSFWSNHTTGLSQVKSALRWLADTRNTCMSFGYESVALIPITCEEETFGLIQLNDKRKDCFTKDFILTMEVLAGSLGGALYRSREETLLRKQKNLQAALMTAAVISHESKQPLMSALGYLDMVLVELSRNDQAYNDLVAARKQLLTIDSIINRLLKITDSQIHPDADTDELGDSKTVGKKRILVVDDQKEVVDFLKVLLEANGFHYCGVTGSRAALHEVNDNTYDIILLDLKIGRENGAALCRQIRSKCPHIPIICLSGSILTEDKNKLLAAGFDAVYEKPIRNQELISIIKSKTN
jgi:CheY-like chemotaxis protein